METGLNCFAALERKHKHKHKRKRLEKPDMMSSTQRKAFDYYASHTQSIEIVKDDCVQKVNFRVLNKVGFVRLANMV